MTEIFLELAQESLLADYNNLLCNLGPESSNVPRPWEGPYMDETEIAVGKSNDLHRFVWEASKYNTFVAGRSHLRPCQIL